MAKYIVVFKEDGEIFNELINIEKIDFDSLREAIENIGNPKRSKVLINLIKLES